jgi:hypothetical protein
MAKQRREFKMYRDDFTPERRAQLEADATRTGDFITWVPGHARPTDDLFAKDAAP